MQWSAGGFKHSNTYGLRASKGNTRLEMKQDQQKTQIKRIKKQSLYLPKKTPPLCI